MHKTKLLIPALIGLIAGQLFAAGERPFKLVNTIRVGYSDNIDHTEDKQAGSFVTDIIDLSFRAALSDRTDVMVKSQLNLLTESGQNPIQPNLYVMLSHSISPRLLFRLSEYYRSGDKSGGDVNTTNATKNTRYNYFFNNVDGSLDYVLTAKDRLTGSANYSVLRHDQIESYDQTTMGAGLTWRRDLVPQRTYTTINLRRSRTIYDNTPANTPTKNYRDNDYLDSTVLSAGLNHTFNQQWQGHVEAGVTYVQPNFSDVWIVSSSNMVPAGNQATLNPLFKAGLVYSPSPRTRLTGDFALSYMASDNNGYGGQSTRELSFGAQHDITAKLMAKATARFANVTYDAQDTTTGNPTDETEDRMNLDLRLTYKLNRMHFLEAGVSHRQTDRDTGGSWAENRVDVGWRFELN
jgi:hypothetical protein